MWIFLVVGLCFAYSSLRTRPPYLRCYMKPQRIEDSLTYKLNRFTYLNNTVSRLKGLSVADVLYCIRKLDILTDIIKSEFDLDDC